MKCPLCYAEIRTAADRQRHNSIHHPGVKVGAMVSIMFTPTELNEVWSVMEYARMHNFYGDTILETWECEDRKAFESALAKVSKAAGKSETRA